MIYNTSRSPRSINIAAPHSPFHLFDSWPIVFAISISGEQFKMTIKLSIYVSFPFIRLRRLTRKKRRAVHCLRFPPVSAKRHFHCNVVDCGHRSNFSFAPGRIEENGGNFNIRPCDLQLAQCLMQSTPIFGILNWCVRAHAREREGAREMERRPRTATIIMNNCCEIRLHHPNGIDLQSKWKLKNTSRWILRSCCKCERCVSPVRRIQWRMWIFHRKSILISFVWCACGAHFSGGNLDWLALSGTVSDINHNIGLSNGAFVWHDGAVATATSAERTKGTCICILLAGDGWWRTKAIVDFIIYDSVIDRFTLNAIVDIWPLAVTSSGNFTHFWIDATWLAVAVAMVQWYIDAAIGQSQCERPQHTAADLLRFRFASTHSNWIALFVVINCIDLCSLSGVFVRICDLGRHLFIVQFDPHLSVRATKIHIHAHTRTDTPLFFVRAKNTIFRIYFSQILSTARPGECERARERERAHTEWKHFRFILPLWSIWNWYK